MCVFVCVYRYIYVCEAPAHSERKGLPCFKHAVTTFPASR